MYDFAYMECSVAPGVTLPTYRANRTPMPDRMDDIVQLQSELANTLLTMSANSEAWIEARAGGRDTSALEREWKNLDQNRRRLERVIARRRKAQEKRDRT